MSIYGAVAREVTKLNEIRDRQAQEGMITSSSTAISSDSGSSSAIPRSRTTSGAGKTRAQSADDHAEDADKLSRRLSTLSSVSASSTATARPSGQDRSTSATGRDMTASPVQESEEEEEELLSESASGISSRMASVPSTPAEERLAQLDAPKDNISALSTPALSPQPTSTQAGNQSSTPGVDVDVDVDTSLSKALETQHISQIDVKPPSEINRVDQVLNDVFGLLSLFFLTIGKTKESPGTYVQIASMRVSRRG
jgi:hypothetical protein